MLSDILILKKNEKIIVYKNMIKYNIFNQLFITINQILFRVFLW